MYLNNVTRCARLSLSLSYMKYCGHPQEPRALKDWFHSLYHKTFG